MTAGNKIDKITALMLNSDDQSTEWSIDWLFIIYNYICEKQKR